MSLSMLSELRRLNKQQWATADELEFIATQKLRRQLSRAAELSPFYRKRFAGIGFDPQDLRVAEDIRGLPLTTRAEFIAAGKDMFCSDIDISKCTFAKSSGSSGAPIFVPLTKRDKRHRILKELRALTACGFKFTDRMLVIWVPRATIEKVPVLQRLGILRREYASVFASEEEQLAAINSIRPEVLYSYTSNFRILADAILADGRAVSKPKLLVTSAELLDLPSKASIAQAFGTEPIDYYGSMEVGWIAWQCPERQGHHINSDCVIVECLKDGRPAKPGEEGEVVITNLHSDAAPLIRYATGDTAVMSRQRCSCGRTLPLLSEISGRMADYFVLPDGRRLSPYSVTSALRDVPGMHQFQVIQESQRLIKVRMIAGPVRVEDDSIRQAVWKGLGTQMSVDIEYMQTLPREANGKFKIVKSLNLPRADLAGDRAPANAVVSPEN